MTEVPFSRKNERAVTPFVGQELLYDYLRGELDPERVLALEKLLAENRDLKNELEKIRDGLNYVLDLQKTQVSAELAEGIRTPSTYFHVLLQKMRFTEWPEGVKLAAEGIVIGVGALALILLIPWGRILSWKSELEKTSIVLTEVSKERHSDPDVDTAPKVETETKPSASPAPAAAAPVAVAKNETKTEPAKPEAKKTESKKPGPAQAPAKPVATATEATPIRSAAPDSGKKQGFIYRGSVHVTSLETASPKFAEFIIANGGQKAGDVELGWKKGKGTYFHFTLPADQYEPLLDLFKEYGTVKISKEPHPRVMPDGVIRLIITVDEK